MTWLFLILFNDDVLNGWVYSVGYRDYSEGWIQKYKEGIGRILRHNQVILLEEESDTKNNTHVNSWSRGKELHPEPLQYKAKRPTHSHSVLDWTTGIQFTYLEKYVKIPNEITTNVINADENA
jgi:hypothetical protein